MLAEHPLHRSRLGPVTEGRAGAVGVDVLHAVGGQFRVLQRHRHGMGGAAALFVGLRDVARIAAGPVALEFGVDAGAALLRVFSFFNHHDARALGEHEAVALDVEGTAGLLRRLAPKRQRPHVLESGQTDRREGRLAGAGHHHVGVAILNRPHGAADRVGGTRAGRGHGEVGPFDPVEARHVAAGRVDHQLWNGERRHLVDALVEQPLLLGLKLPEPADAGTDDDTAAVGIFHGEVETRVGDGVFGRGQSELRESIEPLEILE